MSHDLVIRGGTIIDGIGSPAVQADIAIGNGRITAIGQVIEKGAEEIDATGRIVTPGFVDIHTHFDGHVTWASRLDPASQHGVTTVLMGNCGVGFAPCKPGDHDRLIHLMEGVEDIPEVVMAKGLPWNWQSFPDYLDRLDERQFDMDVATQIPHAPLRVFVMGERAAARSPATPDDIAKMRDLAQQAIEAGALGFSTSRTLAHRAVDGTVTPTFGTAAEELGGIASGLKRAGKGVLQVVTEFDDLEEEFGILRHMMEESGRRPLSTTILQFHHAPERWRRIMEKIDEANRDGYNIKGQVSGRPVGFLMGLDFGRNPFMYFQAYREIAHLPLPERIAALRGPERRAAILSSKMPENVTGLEKAIVSNFGNMADYKDGYEPKPDRNFTARAAAQGITPAEFAYDFLLENEGENIILMTGANFFENKPDAMLEMITHRNTIQGLGDAGAHCGILCDASLPTWMLQRWSTTAGGPIPLETIIKRLTSETARAVGLHDRGILAPGYRADLNIIDTARIDLGPPQIYTDLPDSGRRLGQPAAGYDATIVAGAVTYRHGEATGALPGRLIRGAQAAPA